MFSDQQVTFTLAGLTYRGFDDLRLPIPHTDDLRRKLLDGLSSLSPVKDEWDLVWGPAASGSSLGGFDTNAMYVVQSRTAPHRLVVAIRGTNPVSGSDWLFGDLWVGRTVPWPWANDGAAISTSTALGLAAFQAMPKRGASAFEASMGGILRGVAALMNDFEASATRARDALVVALNTDVRALETRVEALVTHWCDPEQEQDRLRKRLRENHPPAIHPERLHHTWHSPAAGATDLDLLQFLHARAERAGEPLEVTVTGHSKGGALAPTVALWLRETRDDADDAEGWDPTRRARVRCYGFAGPTPGNAAFADRVGEMLGADHHRLANTNDLVTRAWNPVDIEAVPRLYGAETAPLKPLAELMADHVRPLGYTHIEVGAEGFQGRVGMGRSLPAELVHQHMEAYLEHLGLSDIPVEEFFF